MLLKYFVITLISLESFILIEGNVIVRTTQGWLEGKSLLSREGREFIGFLSVPYGQAGRFEAPQAASKWEGIFQATEYSNACAQMTWISFEHLGNEDCLTLHVFTPNVTGNLPVVVYFHGGGFTVGTANSYGPNYFMDEDIVLVMVNYRVGPFGFLSTGDEILPGNYGLKDQSLSLKWVRDNIENVGGNPARVTILGNSAGAAAVNYHMLSPLSKGLFHGAKAQSGSLLNPWAKIDKPKWMAEKFGKALNCSRQGTVEYKNCLLTKSTDEILTGMKYLVEWGYDPFTPFGPVVEPNSPGAFLTEDPEILMETGRIHKVPIIMGLNEDEGILMHASYILHNPNLLQEFNQDWQHVYPITFEYNEFFTNLTLKAQNEISAKIRKYYFKNQPVRNDNPEAVQSLINVYSDRYFNQGVRKAGILMAKHLPVYLYMFAHNRGDFTFPNVMGIDQNYGVSHGDEITFQFSNFLQMTPEFLKGSAAENISKAFVKLWASFVQNGYPKEMWGLENEWSSITEEEINGKKKLRYCRISDEINFVDEPFTERCKFWETILLENTKHFKDEL